MNRSTRDEINALKPEAERRARAGQSRTNISRQLGVPLYMLARWAFQDGWRQKDLAAEASARRREQQQQ